MFELVPESLGETTGVLPGEAESADEYSSRLPQVADIHSLAVGKVLFSFLFFFYLTLVFPPRVTDKMNRIFPVGD